MALQKKFPIVFITLLLSLCLRSQQPPQYAYTHYRVADGLASNIVNNVIQDYRGYIWLSTINGLQRFDGNKFLTFKTDAARINSLPSDDVNKIFEDGAKNLWVLTGDNKVGIFNTRTFQYKETPLLGWNKESLYQDKTFIETGDGTLLLHFRYTNKLFQYHPSENTFRPSAYVPFPHNKKVNFLLQDKVTQKFFMATDTGLVIYNPITKALSYQGHNKENEPLITHCGAERFINLLYIDANRRLFFEQWPPSAIHPLLKLFDLNTHIKKEHNLKKEYNFGYHQFRALLEQQNGKIWIYGLPFLAEYTTGTDPFQFLKKDYNKEKDIKFNKVFSMYEDSQRNVWVCTDYGIYLFNPDAQLFHNYTLTTPKRFTVEGRAQTALQLQNGDIWVGYRDLGLYRYDKNFKPLSLPASIVPHQDSKSVWDIHQHNKTGNLWIALQGGKLIVYDTVSRRAQLLAPPSFEQRAITQITEDSSGNLWLGTQSGNIVKWDYKAASKNIEAGFTFIHKTGIIDKLLIDKKGYIWVTAFGEGVLKIDPKTHKVVRRISKNNVSGYALWNNDAKDIIQYNDSTLIVASGALNLINVNTNKVNYISTQDGLPSNTVLSLAKDATGVLWLGTLSGLCRADLNKRSFAVYDQNDGILNDDFNVAGGYALNNGKLLFTSAESFVVFDPLKTRRTGAADKAFITGFKLSNVSLSVDSLLSLDRVRLGYNKNSVVFEFSALNYCKQNKLDYYYRLQNFDSSWIKSDGRHLATYNFLPPGKYSFQVKTKNIDGVFSNETAQLNIWVAPPFWKTWWFYILLLLTVILILYLIDRERIKRLVTLHNVRTDIASHLHLDVSTTLNNINVLSQIAKLKADRDIIRSKELIDEISDKSYNMVVTMDEILWSIDPSNDTMEKTLQRIFEYAQTLETNYGATIDIVVHEKVKDLQLDMKVRHAFLIVCKEALESLAQYAKNKNILIDIDLIRSKIVLKILSIGAEVDEGSKNMNDLKEKMTRRAADMHATLAFEAGKKETSIVLSIPLK